MLVHIGTGKESAQHVANRLLKILVDKGHEAETAMDYVAGDMSTGKMPPMLTSVKAPKKHEAHTSNGVVVKGVDDVLVRLSQVLQPGAGRRDSRLRDARPRRVGAPRRLPERSRISSKPPGAYHRGGLGERSAEEHVVQGGGVLGRARPHEPARDVAIILSEQGANVLSSSTTSHRDGMVEMRFLFQVSDINHDRYRTEQTARHRRSVRRAPHGSQGRRRQEKRLGATHDQ